MKSSSGRLGKEGKRREEDDDGSGISPLAEGVEDVRPLWLLVGCGLWPGPAGAVCRWNLTYVQRHFR